MPIHDWSKVRHDIFHDFHGRWITHITEALNEGVLPEEYYAQSEKKVERAVPDVVTLHVGNGSQSPGPISPSPGSGGPKVSLLDTVPPQVSVCMEPDTKARVARNRIAIHRAEDDETVAVIEVVSPGNKCSVNAIGVFVKKSRRLVLGGVHLLIVDLLPPGPRDPQGVHSLIWKTIDTTKQYIMPPEKPLTFVSYRGNPGLRAYLEPSAVGDSLKAMPLFLSHEAYVNVPLEEAYQRTIRGMPRRNRNHLEK